ncbi:MAG: 30S ribosomal protein S9 [Candidatus Woesearchaeota archaeon]
MKLIIQTSGKRKKANARATLVEGKGRITINNMVIDNYKPEFAKIKLFEPLFLAGESAKQVDIKVRVSGGGIIGQTEAVRLAIAKALAEYNPKFRSIFSDYDWTLETADVRQREVRKPNTHGNARGKVQKSYR